MAENQPEEVGSLEAKAKEFDVSLLEKAKTDPTSLTPDEVKAITENAQTQHALVEHWRGKAKDPKTGKTFADLFAEASKSHSQPNPNPPAEGTDETVTRLAALEAAEEKRQFGHANGLSPEETDHAFALAKGMGKKPEAVLDTQFFKAGVEQMRKTARTSDATPGPSSRSPIVEGKTFAQKTPEERKRDFPKVAQGFQAKR